MNATAADVRASRTASPLPGEPITLELRDELEALLSPLRDGLSEYSFTKLFLWREQHGYRLQRGELPCIAGFTFDGEQHLLPLFDVAAVDAGQLRARLADYDCYFPVSERRAAGIDRNLFASAASADDADYVYAVTSFLKLPDGELAEKRGEFRELLRHGQPVAAPFGRSTVAAAQAVVDASAGEGNGRSALTDGPNREAIERAAELGLQGHVYFLEDEPIGFVLGEIVAEQMMVVHVAKAHPGLPGVQPMMFHHTAMAVSDRVRWFNFEQDLGFEDFRIDKQAYLPASLLQKHRLRPSDRG